MLKKLFLPIFLTALLSSIIGCNSESDDVTYIEASGASVTAFSLRNDPKVLDSLSNVFFSIDLLNGKIFNADSLPYGTKVSKLLPNITASSGASEIKLTYRSGETLRDSVVNYITNSGDSIDFSNGPVKLTIVSQSGLVTRDYEIKVNVHKVKADSLAWFQMETAPLPTSFGVIKAQYSVRKGDKFYCLTSDGNEYCLAVTENPDDPQWQIQTVTFDFVPDVESLRATDDALYMLSTDGSLYKSFDFESWTETGVKWHYIYGGYNDQILGCATDAGGNTINSYPNGQSWAMPADFPVEAASQTRTYTLPMGYAPQLVMVGGRLADGQLTNVAWSFDGNNWAKMSIRPMPLALEYVTLVAYSLVETPSSTWAPVSYPVLMAMGGRVANGAINRKVFYSRDWGLTWSEAPSYIQIPTSITAVYGSSAFEYTSTMHVDSRSDGWTEIPVRKLPPSWSFITPKASSRAVKPVTEWECPAIYLLGGRDYDGNTINHIWRGVIYQYTFVPVQ